MGLTGKWIEGVTPDSDVSDAAQRSLEARLAAVQHHLPLAALIAEQDVEHVHRLRVATRRAVAALRLYKDFLPRRRRGELKQMLNNIRRAAGAARDLDVLTMRLMAAYGDELGPILDEIAARRAKAQASIHNVYEAAMKEGAAQQLMFETLERVRPRRRRDKKRKRVLFANWAQRRLTSTAEEFFAAQPSDSHDYLALHQFRVCGKGLRYVMELLAGAFAADFRKEVYPRVEELQERLGTINDHYTAAMALSEWEQLAVSETDAELLYHKSRLRMEH